MSKIADANYMLKATAEEGEVFQVLGVGDSESRLCGSFFFLSQVLETRTQASVRTLTLMSYLQAVSAAHFYGLRTGLGNSPLFE